MTVVVLAGFQDRIGAAFPYLVQTLASYGYEVQCVETGDSLLALLRSTPVVCVVLEARLAITATANGRVLVDDLPAALPRVTIGSIRTMGYDWVKLTYTSPIHEFLNMPFSVEELVARIENVLNR
jgi:DNA-binding response OmpR family regulator